jgi:phage replication-related protein YjqB (UPF0714/DUF867 family)
MRFADVLAHPGVREECVLAGTFGFMAFHGGALEERTDDVAREAAEASGASYYGVLMPDDMKWHLPSHLVDPDASPLLSRFIGHVEVVVTVHGYGRRGLFTSLLLGGRNRRLAGHLAGHLRRCLPAYDIVDDLDAIPRDLRGQHQDNPVNRPAHAGVQLELPPRVRGNTPLFWDWEGPGHPPHMAALIAGLADAATSWSQSRAVTAPA